MAQHDHRNWDHQHSEHPRRPGPGQMEQYADHNRQHGGPPYRGHDGQGYERGSWDAPERRNEGMQQADRAQASYGRYGAPDVHGPAGRGYGDGYDYGRPRHPGYPGQPGPERDHRTQGHGDEDDRGRYQGGGGGYQSNAGEYANTQRYGGAGDQTGYGSGPGYGPHDPDYQQWRRQQMESLDAEYASWRGERYQKFAEDFGAWRSSRHLPAQSDHQGKPEPSGAAGGGGATAIGPETGSGGQAGKAGSK